MLSRNEIIQEVKEPKLSSWDVVYALNMAIACLITYWILTLILFRLVDMSSDLLDRMGRHCVRLQRNASRERQQPVLRLVDTVVGIAVGVACNVSAHFCFMGFSESRREARVHELGRTLDHGSGSGLRTGWRTSRDRIALRDSSVDLRFAPLGCSLLRALHRVLASA